MYICVIWLKKKAKILLTKTHDIFNKVNKLLQNLENFETIKKSSCLWHFKETKLHSDYKSKAVLLEES